MTSAMTRNDQYVAARVRDREVEIGRMLSQSSELHQRVIGGRLDVFDVRRGLQHLIEGKPVAPTRPSSYFVSLFEQVENIERWNAEFNWGIKPELIARRVLEAQTFTWPADSLQALVLVPTFANPVSTFFAIRKAATKLRHWGYNLMEHLAKPGNMYLRDGVAFKPYSLEWRLVDLGAYVQRRGARGSNMPLLNASELVTPDVAAGVEVIAAAAHFPRWLDAIKANHAPNVSIPAYGIASTITETSSPRDMLTIYYSSGCIGTTLHDGTDTMWDGYATATAVPVPITLRVG